MLLQIETSIMRFQWKRWNTPQTSFEVQSKTTSLGGRQPLIRFSLNISTTVRTAAVGQIPRSTERILANDLEWPLRGGSGCDTVNVCTSRRPRWRTTDSIRLYREFHCFAFILDVERPPAFDSLVFEQRHLWYSAISLEHVQCTQLGWLCSAWKTVHIQR